MEITVTPQGPYVVTGGTPVRRARQRSTERDEPIAWEYDEAIETEETYELCRCGGSQDKPFCDRTHEAREWDGAESAPTSSYDERAKVLGGNGITVRDDRKICEHAGFCTNKVTNVWKMVKDSEPTTVRSQLAAMVERCPSGALTYSLPESSGDVEPLLAPGIAAVDDGPLRVTGGVTVRRADGAPLETRNRMTLCRCGASKNKPLCDGSHVDAGFRDS